MLLSASAEHLLLLLRAEDTKIGKSRKVLPDCFIHTAE